ncbi:uncharacterized protein LOC18782225 isoform X2 [Prunus persica]|uniref:uncharacterized protein LOC18782225 isoform X2 n=1 Tax=Prunus persica TaxID=3760 RepID=UPI0009AB8A31|nr:uncharacterized protein LOC18782225 isoform X2 [Prunus persica]
MAMVSWNLGVGPHPKLLQVSCRKKERNRDNIHPYKVIEITPPPKNLGIRCFPSVLQGENAATLLDSEPTMWGECDNRRPNLHNLSCNS